MPRCLSCISRTGDSRLRSPICSQGTSTPCLRSFRRCCAGKGRQDEGAGSHRTKAQRARTGGASVGELGFPQLESLAWIGLLAPAGTPQDVVRKLNAEAVRSMRTAQCASPSAAGVRRGRQLPRGIRGWIRTEQSKWSNVIKQSGATAIDTRSAYSYNSPLHRTRGGAVWQLVGLITRRSEVQILSPQPSLFKNSQPIGVGARCGRPLHLVLATRVTK